MNTPEERYKRQLARQNTKVTCECGKVVSRGNLKVHRTNNIHKKRMEKLKLEGGCPPAVTFESTYAKRGEYYHECQKKVEGGQTLCKCGSWVSTYNFHRHIMGKEHKRRLARDIPEKWIHLRAKDKFTCDCGKEGLFRMWIHGGHQQSKFHQNYLKKNQLLSDDSDYDSDYVEGEIILYQPPKV